MDISAILMVVLLCAMAWYVTTTILILGVLRKRNINVNFMLLRILLFRYVSQYNEITLKETGKVGSLFYHMIISVNVALVSAILMLLTR